MSDIVVIGSLNMDLVIRTPRAPEAGETVRGYGFQTIPGGKGANQAAAVGRLGGAVSMVGRVGDDQFGERLVASLGRQRVDTGHVTTDATAPTGVAVITVEDTGENRIIVWPGANGQVCTQDIDEVADLLAKAEVIILQFEIPLEVVDYAIEKATEHPVKVILNPAPVTRVSDEFLSRVDCLVPNETETRILTGIEAVDLTTAGRAGKDLLSRGVHDVVITLGDKGALWMTEGATTHIPAIKVKAIDTTAAGDAFVGGLAVGMVRGLAMQDAVRYGSCAGALTVMKLGAQTSLPSAEEVSALFEGDTSVLTTLA